MKDPSGNALFLILVAVALYAALSYAVTQSGREGRSADRETTIINAAKYQNQFLGVRTAMLRLTLTGTNTADIEFCSSGAGACTITDADDYCTTGDNCLFSATGGGAAPIDVDLSSSSMHYTTTGTIDGIGGSSAEISLAMQNVDEDLCAEFNKGHTGSSTIPGCVTFACNTFFSGGTATIDASNCADCVGEPAMCMNYLNFNLNYQYYYVLLEQ